MTGEFKRMLSHTWEKSKLKGKNESELFYLLDDIIVL